LAAATETKYKDEEAERQRFACVPSIEVTVRPCHDPSTALAPLFFGVNRRSKHERRKELARSGRDDRLAVLAAGTRRAYMDAARAKAHELRRPSSRRPVEVFGAQMARLERRRSPD
jgi:hypothetical protein